MSRHILIVDDDPLLRRSLAFHLEQAGYRVDTAANAEDALALVRRSPPNLILLDIGLPGMDGYAVAQRVRQWDSHRPTLIIAVSGYGQPKDERRSRQSGFDHFLVKPVVFRILQSLLMTANGYAATAALAPAVAGRKLYCNSTQTISVEPRTNSR